MRWLAFLAASLLVACSQPLPIPSTCSITTPSAPWLNGETQGIDEPAVGWNRSKTRSSSWRPAGAGGEREAAADRHRPRPRAVVLLLPDEVEEHQPALGVGPAHGDAQVPVQLDAGAEVGERVAAGGEGDGGDGAGFLQRQHVRLHVQARRAEGEERCQVHVRSNVPSGQHPVARAGGAQRQRHRRADHRRRPADRRLHLQRPGGTGRTCVARPHPVSTSAGARGQGKRTVVESSGLLAGRVQRTALPGYASDCAQAD